MNKTKKRRKTQRRRRKMTGGIFGFFSLREIYVGEFGDNVAGVWELRKIRSTREIQNDNVLQQGLINMNCMFITQDTIYNLNNGPVSKLLIDTREYISEEGYPVTEHNEVFVLYFDETIIGYISCRVFINETTNTRLCYVKYECCNMSVAIDKIDQGSKIYPGERASIIMQAFLIEYMRTKYDVTCIYKQLLIDNGIIPYLSPLLYTMRSGYSYNPYRLQADNYDLSCLGIEGGNYSKFYITNIQLLIQLRPEQIQTLGEQQIQPLGEDQLALIETTLRGSIYYKVHDNIQFKEYILDKYSEEDENLAINAHAKQIMDDYNYRKQVLEMYLVTRLLNMYNVGTAPNTKAPIVSPKTIKKGLKELSAYLRTIEYN